MARNKNKPYYKEVLIEDIGAEGKSLAKIGDLVVFTQLVVPGDIVDIQVTKKRKKYQEGKVIRIHEFSADRAEAFCCHFGVCGGCKWQNLPYTKQLFYKEKQIKEQLKRIGKIEFSEIKPILSSEQQTFYRNKLEFTFSNKKWLTIEEVNNVIDPVNMNSLGFHVSGMFNKIINIEKCWLQPEPSNKIRNFIYNYAVENQLDFFDISLQQGFLRTLIIRTTSTGETMVLISFFKYDKTKIETFLNVLVKEFSEITSLMFVINEKGNDNITDQDIFLFYGRDYILEEMEDLKFKIGPKSFYQTNSGQAYKLYKIVRDFAGLNGSETVYDLYTGTGTIANFVARNSKKVIGIEYVPEAIEDAKTNSEFNNIGNTLFFAGDIKNVLNDEFVIKNGKPDIIIIDPPRAGVHADVINTIISILPEKIVYVSCNPATQARDILSMSGKYKTIKIQPVDMFPHTHHVENVVLLEKV
ncbi:MAG: 23S rRNA (uracil(1939)-C(5))-methyltransferase RlmD [Bacteroidales bacterium]|nr:23S rRNA (uracil(1939)-C(5))-methyltransferase RlmD [Bacteroidales bacterium]